MVLVRLRELGEVLFCRSCLFFKKIISMPSGLSYWFFQEWSLMGRELMKWRKKTWMLWCLFLLLMLLMEMVLMKVMYRLWATLFEFTRFCSGGCCVARFCVVFDM